MKEMNEYLKCSHAFAINQAIERAVFEYCIENELHMENTPLDLESIKKLLANGENFSESEYELILNETRKKIVKYLKKEA